MSKALNFGKMAYQMTARLEFISPTKVKMFIPGGFPYESFNSCAYVTPWSMMQMADSHRIAAFSVMPASDGTGPFLDVHRLFQDYFIFMVTARLDVYPEMYEHFLQKGPLVSEMEVVNISEKSFCLRTTTSIEDSATPLAVTYSTSIFVSTKSRKTSAPPDWWNKKFKPHYVKQSEELRLPRLEVAGKTPLSSYSAGVSLSDVDPYHHLTWTNCIKFCYNAFISHRLKDPSWKKSGELNRNVKSLTANYLKEAPLGDQVDVKMWRADGGKDVEKYDFQILKGSDVTNETRIEFYPEDM